MFHNLSTHHLHNFTLTIDKLTLAIHSIDVSVDAQLFRYHSKLHLIARPFTSPRSLQLSIHCSTSQPPINLACIACNSTLLRRGRRKARQSIWFRFGFIVFFMINWINQKFISFHCFSYSLNTLPSFPLVSH